MVELREVYQMTEPWGQVLVKDEDGIKDKNKRLLSEQEISESENFQAEQFWLMKCKVKPGDTIIFKKGGHRTEASENSKDIPKGG